MSTIGIDSSGERRCNKCRRRIVMERNQAEALERYYNAHVQRTETVIAVPCPHGNEWHALMFRGAMEPEEARAAYERDGDPIFSIDV